jgi:RNA polymerase sigma factor (TIGR02999 family)
VQDECVTEPSERPSMTDLFEGVRHGAPGSLAQVFEHTYDELRTLASARLRGCSADCALETTALVHETFLRFAQTYALNVADRTHFFRYVGRVMRSVIVDCVRERRAQRRGCGATLLPLTRELAEDLAGEQQILGVHRALEELAECEPRVVDVVQLRYFAGLTDSEIAGALGVTSRTVRRDWEKARLLLTEVLEC